MQEKYSQEELAKLPFMDSDLDLEKRVEDLLGRLTLEEKFSLSKGKWNAVFHVNPIKRLGIKAYKMTDGPHGIGSGVLISRIKTTYFPGAIGRCATWNPKLSEEFGIAIGQEVREIGFNMLLAPGINILRTPLCGRTFEYQTEDPYLNSRTVVALVKGLQSQRIAACVKHYACNNQEHERFKVSSEVSERALQEIYLPAFKATVQEADAWSFMSCYNKVNGIYGSENKDLLKDRLRDEWGFRGFVVSDWFATRYTTSTENCMNAGLSLEMPGSFSGSLLLIRSVFTKKQLRKAFLEGKFSEETLNENIRRFLRVMFLTGHFDAKSKLPPGSRATPEHITVSRRIAEEGIVLLKNENNILPLNIEKITKIAVLGPNAKKKMAFGGGSSLVRSKYEITPLKGLQNKCQGKIEFVKTAAEADVTIIFAGLNHKGGNDCEGSDRKSLDLPQKQIDLIKQTTQENKNTIVVLINGSPIAMDDWIDKVPAIIEAWYAGLEGGNVIADILFGNINPSGKLPITFPKKLSDSPAHQSPKTYPGTDKVFYEEGIFVGYRHFDTKNIEPLFPFGHGLSYTTFTYENLQIDKETMSEDDKISISLDIINAGERAGAEVVQLYVQDVESSIERPLKELKGFQKIFLGPSEKGSVTFELSKPDLSFYDETNHCWTAEQGIFKILLGSSSRDIRLEGQFEYLA